MIDLKRIRVLSGIEHGGEHDAWCSCCWAVAVPLDAINNPERKCPTCSEGDNDG